MPNTPKKIEFSTFIFFLSPPHFFPPLLPSLFLQPNITSESLTRNFIFGIFKKKKKLMFVHHSTFNIQVRWKNFSALMFVICLRKLNTRRLWMIICYRIPQEVSNTCPYFLCFFFFCQKWGSLVVVSFTGSHNHLQSLVCAWS